MKVSDLYTDYFMEEGCAIYALALSRLLPYNTDIGVISNNDGESWGEGEAAEYGEFTHVFLETPNGTVDCKGLRSVDDMAEDLHLHSYSIEGPWFPKVFGPAFVGDNDSKPLYGNPKDIEATMEWIKSTQVDLLKVLMKE